MIAEQNDPIFYAFDAEDHPRCPQCSQLMHLTGRKPSVVLGDADEFPKFACDCNFETARNAAGEGQD